jgi:hypothetical protein
VVGTSGSEQPPHPEAVEQERGEELTRLYAQRCLKPRKALDIKEISQPPFICQIA